MSLSRGPIELCGEWRESSLDEVGLVVARLRDACFAGTELPSDRQPVRLKIEGRVAAVPHVWLDGSNPQTASIVIDGSGRNWCRMSYQLGHELGHVVCNSWQVDALPLRPSQWLEECLAEAFSLRGLARLADSWDEDPVLPEHADYGKHLRRYRELTIAPYRRSGPPFQLHHWFAQSRKLLEKAAGCRPASGPAMLMILAELDRDPACVADLGAVNRWPGRAAVRLEEYLESWQHSCAEVSAPGRLPARIRDVLFFDEPAPNFYNRPAQPNLQHPNRWEIRQEVVTLDEQLADDHPARAVWALADGLDLAEFAGAPGGPARPAPALLWALWLWATIDGIGASRHVARLCDQQLAYRWLCGGVAVDHAMLSGFRGEPGGAIDRLLARGLAVLVEEGIVALDLLAPGELTARRLAGDSAARRRRRLAALTEAAAARLTALSDMLDRDDPIADEYLARCSSGERLRNCREHAKRALARMSEITASK